MPLSPLDYITGLVLRPFQRISANRALFMMLLRNDVKAKFRHSILGVFWLFIPPLLVLLIYVYMFSFIFKMRWPDADFSSRWGVGLFIYTGIAVYSVFSDSVMGSLNLLPARAGMLKRVLFPFELFPVSLVTANVLVSGVVLWLIFFLSLLTGGHGSWKLLWYFPLVYLPYALFICGVCWITAALGVFFRDLGNLLGILLLVVFFVSPVLYSAKMVPEQLGWVIHFNPLSPVIRNVRCIFLLNAAPDGAGVFWSWVIGFFVFQAGFRFFERMRRRFADVI